MSELRILARTLVIHNSKILLVRNRGADFWLTQLNSPTLQHESELEQHIDLDPDGMVEEGRWYAQAELANLKVFPERVKHYGDYLNELPTSNPFIGTFK
jgi:hypothetical protein